MSILMLHEVSFEAKLWNYKLINVIKISFIAAFGNVAKMNFNVAINGILISHKNEFTMLQKNIFIITQNCAFLMSQKMSQRNRLFNVVIKGCLKVVSATFLLICFLCLKDSTCGTRKNVFISLAKLFLVLRNQILTFQIFKCHEVIKCPSIKHEIHFIE